MNVVSVATPEERPTICQTILSDLPEWFGRPDATAAYVATVAQLTTFACFLNARPVGFASVQHETPEAIDVHVMGVRRAYHRRGIGKALVPSCAEHAHGRCHVLDGQDGGGLKP